MPDSNNISYAYAVARIRAIEKKLLDKVKLDRMIDARSPEEAVKVLAEADYGYTSPEPDNVYQYEKLLIEEQLKVYSLLKEIAPETEVFNLFLQTNDYHNIRVVLKAEFSDQEVNDAILMKSGSFDAGKIKAMVKDRNLSDMPPIMRRAVEECIDAFNRMDDPQVIDLILDKAAFRQMKEISDSSKSSFLKELVEIQTDLANFKIFLRVKRLGKSWDFLQKVLIPGGRIDRRLYIEKFESPLEDFSEALRYTKYGTFVEEGVSSIRNTGSMTRFEKLSDNYVISYIRKAKYATFSIEPLIGYLLAKENEIKNVRIVMVGKINNIPNDIIRERLRETYA